MVKFFKILILVSLLLLVSTCKFPMFKTVKVISPEKDAMIIGDEVNIVFQCPEKPNLQLKVNNISSKLEFTKSPFRNRWISKLDLGSKGSHKLNLSGFCNNKEFVDTRTINNLRTNSVAVADELIASVFDKKDADDLSWYWESAIFLYPLARIAKFSEQGSDYLAYLERYHHRYVNEDSPGKINHADWCTSALSGYELERNYDKPLGNPNTKQVIDFIKTTPRNSLGSIDHLGTSIARYVIPSSIWVDSLMMWALLAVQYGNDNNDQELLEFGLRQALIFESVLLDGETDLLFHAWNLVDNHRYPKKNVPWLRGNGWVLAAVALMLEEIDSTNKYYEPLRKMFVNLAKASKAYRTETGYWDTVIAQPGYGYEESSGSALVAYSFSQGVNLGLLDSSYKEIAKDTFSAITARMKKKNKGYSMEDISVGTNPSKASTYKIIPVASNKLYGVGSFLLLAESLRDDTF